MKNYHDELADLKAKNQYRILRDFLPISRFETECNGQHYCNLSSNDYLGIAFNEELHREFYSNVQSDAVLRHYGLGSSSSRLLTGNNFLYTQLETLLAAEYEKEAALVFNSGYHANIGILPCLMNKGDAIFSDKLNHASIIDGIRLSSADAIRYKHADYAHLEQLLEKNRDKYNNAIIVSESIFSMDGDVVNLNKLVELKNKYHCMLYVDEAHAIGTRGSKGLGIAEEQNCMQGIDFLVGTFGKALASQGAFVVCKEWAKEYFVNKSRSLIFTTALPPVSLHWTRFIFSKSLQMHEIRAQLHALSAKLRQSLYGIGYESISQSNIIPILLYDNKKAEECARLFQDNGLLAFAVRPPTVPQNTARLRLSLSANLTWSELEKIPHILMNVDDKRIC